MHGVYWQAHPQLVSLGWVGGIILIFYVNFWGPAAWICDMCDICALLAEAYLPGLSISLVTHHHHHHTLAITLAIIVRRAESNY